MSLDVDVIRTVACAATEWGYMPKVWTEPSPSSFLAKVLVRLQRCN